MTTGSPRVVPLRKADPVAVPAGVAITDESLDPQSFQSGFDDASAHLSSMPTAWASHHASTTLAALPIPQADDSYARGYRAALYGHLRHSSR